MFAMTIVYCVKCAFTANDINDIDNIQKDLNVLKPTFFYSVPGVLIKFY